LLDSKNQTILRQYFWVRGEAVDILSAKAFYVTEAIFMGKVVCEREIETEKDIIEPAYGTTK